MFIVVKDDQNCDQSSDGGTASNSNGEPKMEDSETEIDILEDMNNTVSEFLF